MTLSRQQLYAAGLPFGASSTRCKPGGRVYGGGGGGSSSNDSNPVTTNTDKRIAVQDGMGLSGDGSVMATDYSTNIQDSSTRNTSSVSSYIDNSNSSDAVKAMTSMGADVIRSSGASVVELAKFQGAQNTDAWNSTLTTGAKLIDRLIDQTDAGMGLSAKVVDSFTPTESKNADIGKYAMIAAAVVAGAVLLKD